jgi:hypothetical protein
MAMDRGLVAEFESADAIARAYVSLETDGFTRVTTYTPYPVNEIDARRPRSRLPWLMLEAGLAGGALGYLVQWWCNGIDFPINVGGRPLQSAPAFIPITFESSVLAASVVGFVAFVATCGLPRVSHPIDAVDGFDRASVDRFWLGVDASDPRFGDGLATRLRELGALRCTTVGPKS